MKKILICIIALTAFSTSSFGQSDNQEEYQLCIGDEFEKLESLAFSCTYIDMRTVNTYIELIPEEYSIERQKSLSKYFSRIPEYVLFNERGCSTEEIEEGNQLAIKRFKILTDKLQAYSDGKTEEFPTEELLSEYYYSYNIHSMRQSEGYVDGGLLNKLFCLRLIEQGAAICPDFKLLTDMVTENGKAAIMNSDKHCYDNQEYCYQPQFDFILIKRDDGNVRVHFCPLDMNRVYQFEGSNGETFYLASSHSTDKSRFHCYMFDSDGDDRYRIMENHNLLKWEEIVEATGGHIIFNPKERCWKICKQKGDLYHQIEGTPALYLDVDNFSFEMRP